MVLFWLDLWEIFFLHAVGFWLMTSESLVLHSTTVPWWLLISPLIISGIYLWCRGMCGGIVLVVPVRDFLFALSGHCTTVPWWFLVSTLTSLEGLVVVLFWLDLWDNFFLPSVGFELWISSPALYHCVMVTSGITSWQFRYLTLVERDWWWFCSDWTCERFSFCPQWDLNQGPLDL